MYAKIIFIYIIITALKEKTILCESHCNISPKTVGSCPSNDTEILEKKRNCQQLLDNQKCKKIFYYHCVINEYGNTTLEVCAPNITIKGFCTEFNEKAKRIQDNFYLPCTEFKNTPCKKFYASNEAYHYKECYNHTHNVLTIAHIESKRDKFYKLSTSSQSPELKESTQHSQEKNSLETNNLNEENNKLSNDYFLSILSILVILVILIALVIIYLLYNRREQGKGKGMDNWKKGDNDVENVELLEPKNHSDHLQDLIREIRGIYEHLKVLKDGLAEISSQQQIQHQNQNDQIHNLRGKIGNINEQLKKLTNWYSEISSQVEGLKQQVQHQNDRTHDLGENQGNIYEISSEFRELKQQIQFLQETQSRTVSILDQMRTDSTKNEIADRQRELEKQIQSLQDLQNRFSDMINGMLKPQYQEHSAIIIQNPKPTVSDLNISDD